MMAGRIYDLFKKSTGVSTDTRSIQEGNLFFALSGEHFNGNRFADLALEKGAIAAIIDDQQYSGKNKFQVEDVLATLQDLALTHRRNFNVPVLAITGSNGKTTTKELIREVLSTRFTVQATEGNLNNHIGIPLTILKWTNSMELAIVEMGANHVGEIASYCAYTEPTHGLITNIGHAHTETFGGIDGVLRGKTELFDYLKKTDGIPFINTSDERLSHIPKRFTDFRVFPPEDMIIGDHGEFLSYKLNMHEGTTQLTGAYNFNNIAAAVATGREFGITDEEIIAAVSRYRPSNLRSQIIRKGDVTLILDAYNANPDSMRGALENLSMFEGPKVAILGDMNELSDSDEEHLSVGRQLAQMELDEIILVGQKIKVALKEVPTAKHFDTAADVQWIPNCPCTVLLKASRTIKLELIAESL